MGMRVFLNDRMAALQQRNVVSNFVDKLTEAAIRRELRVIERGQGADGEPPDADVEAPASPRQG